MTETIVKQVGSTGPAGFAVGVDKTKVCAFLTDMVKKIKKGDIVVLDVQRTMMDSNDIDGAAEFQTRTMSVTFHEKCIVNANDDPIKPVEKSEP